MERRPFLEAVVEEQRAGPGAWGVSSLYIDCGRYADQVQRYLDRFGEQVLVSLFEDFVADQPATVAAIHEFLGVGPTDQAVGPRRTNPASLPRNVLSGRLLGSGRVRDLRLRKIG